MISIKKIMKLSMVLIGLSFAQDASDIDDDQCRYDGANVPCKSRKRTGLEMGDVPGTEDERNARRYNDLRDMFKKFWAKNGLKGKEDRFDEQKYWNYGCHCLMLESVDNEHGTGKPKDALDQKCREFKNCIKCAAGIHGPQCSFSTVKFTWRWNSRKKDFQSMDREGSCPQELFQCGKQYVKDTFTVRELFDRANHPLMSAEVGSTFDHRDSEFCYSAGRTDSAGRARGGGGEHQCCGGFSQPYRWINVDHYQCCSDGVARQTCF